jgi:transposase
MRPTAGTGTGDATAPGTASTTRSGTWSAPADGRDPEPSAAVLDAQSIVSGEGGQARGFDMAKRTRGRKRHLVVDTLGLVLVVTVTSAAVQDRPGGRAILARLAAVFPTVGLVWADGGYANRIDNSLPAWAAAKLRLVVPIVKRSDDVKASRCCRAAGSWSARSAGWSATVASPATTNA